jgi:tetratricopeptide (TPR) repeat protein
MRSLWRAAGVAVVLAAWATRASPLDDAKAGMKAFDKGDNQAAVRLFSSAINSHRLLRSDQELALVKRAEAHFALGQSQAALADAYSALNLDPADNEAIATRDRAQALLNPAPAQAEAAPPEPSAYLKSQTAYQDALKRYEEQKSADAKRYDEQLAKYNAELKAQAAAREAEASVQGGSQAPRPPTAEISKPVIQAKTPPPKPTVQAAAQPAPKPPVKPAQKAASKPTPPPIERPAIY